MVPPRLRFNYLSTPKDRKEWLEAIRCTRNIMTQPAFDRYRGAEMAPGEAVDGDAEILDFVARQGESAYHPCGTCRMGTDADAVVDAMLRVHGVEGLNVVDASVMPTITNGNLNAPVVMIAEKAADMMLGRDSLPPQRLDYYRHETGAARQ